MTNTANIISECQSKTGHEAEDFSRLRKEEMGSIARMEHQRRRLELDATERSLELERDEQCEHKIEQIDEEMTQADELAWQIATEKVGTAYCFKVISPFPRVLSRSYYSRSTSETRPSSAQLS